MTTSSHSGVNPPAPDWFELAVILTAFGLPLWGVLFADWSVATILIIYWFEALFAALLIPIRLYHTRIEMPVDPARGFRGELRPPRRSERLALAICGTVPYWLFAGLISAVFLDIDRQFMAEPLEHIAAAAREWLDREMIILFAVMAASQIGNCIREIRNGALAKRDFGREYHNSVKPIYVLIAGSLVGMGGPYGILILRLVFELYVWWTGKPWYYLIDRKAERDEKRYQTY
jgi:hypothetical protein